MTTITFDTLKFAERLEKAGVSREMASAIVEAQKDALSEALDTSLATKADVTEVKTDLAVLKWMVGFLIALALAMFARQFLGHL